MVSLLTTEKDLSASVSIVSMLYPDDVLKALQSHSCVLAFLAVVFCALLYVSIF
jgi:hypothetical protein